MNPKILMTCFLLWCPSAFAFPNISAEFEAVGGLQAHQDKVKAAIEKSAKQFNFLVRGLARNRLNETNPVYGIIHVDYQQPPILRMASGEASLVLSGVKVEAHPFTTPKGESVTVDQTIGATHIHRVFHTKTGRRSVTYVLNETHTELTLTVAVSSQYMDTDLTYDLVYRQKEQ